MAVFLVHKLIHLNKINKIILDEIKEYCRQFTKKESCGVIYLNDSHLSFLPCENISQSPDYYFSIDPVILIDYDVQYIVHSHVIGSSQPSESDISNSNELCIPYLIYSLRDNDFFLYENIGV